MDQLTTVIKATPAEIISKIDDLNKQAWEVHITQPKQGLNLSSEAKKLAQKALEIDPANKELKEWVDSL